MKNLLITTLNLTTAVIAISCSVGGKNNPVKVDKPILPVIELSSQSTTLEKEFVTELNAIQNIEVRARVGGYMEKIFVDEGKEVKEGQIIFKISDDEFEADVAKARADLKTAEAEAKTSEVELNRMKTLVEKNVMGRTELQMAQANYDAITAGIERAKSALRNALTRLSYTTIRAPFNGTIDRIPFKLGSYVEAGSLMTTVSDTRFINAYFNVSESEYLQFIKNREKTPLEKLDKVSLVLADGSLYQEMGIIETMEGQFEENTGTIAFRAKFPNPKKILKHNSSGTIILTSQLKDALVLPQKAVFELQDKYYVYVVEKDNRVNMRSFIPQNRIADSYIIKSGLKPGETVVYEGLQKLRDSMLIIPTKIGLDSLSKAASLISDNSTGE